jgi:3-dehydroquinate dehydratase-2
MKILIINGVNLNLLGSREKDIYGNITLNELENKIFEYAGNNFDIEFFQSNIEGEIVEKIQMASGNFDGIIINPGAYTHTSVAILDALIACKTPAIEVHFSNVHAREYFRQNCITTRGCIGQICGLGFKGYILALEYFKNEN